MHVEILTSRHVRAYRELMLRAYAAEPDSFTATVEEREREPESWWLRRLADPRGLMTAFGTFEGDELLGTVTVEFSARPKERHKAKLIAMYVAPAIRRRGAGRALVRALLDHCRERGDICVVQLTVTEGNDAAEALYRAMGFQAFGIEPQAVRLEAGLRGKVHMWKEIGVVNVWRIEGLAD